MPSTYDDTQSRDLDRVRFQLGDTDITTALLSDEAITAALTRTGSVSAAVADLARGLIAYLAMQPIRESADGVTVDYSGRLPALETIATRAADGQSTGGGIAFVPRSDRVAHVDEYGRISRWH